jgi:hypothetical protein
MSPLDARARRLHGVGVVVSNRLASGTGLLGDFRGSSQQYQTGPIRIDWSEAPEVAEGETAFEHNQLVFRCEGRFNIAVTRPDGFLAITMAEAS